MSSGKRIFGAFTVAVALFFFWPAVIGGWAKVQAMRAAVAEREALLAKRTEILANVQTSYQEYQQRLGAADGTKFAAFVPVRKDAAEIVSALQDIATESGAQLGEVRTTEARTKVGEQYKTLTLTIDLEGSYPAMRGFLERMEQYVRLLNVQSIEVAPDTQNSGALRFSITADAHFIQ
jgi:Tfp pilus assembly protein PilO